MTKFLSGLSDELKYELIGILLMAAGMISLVSLFNASMGTAGAFINKVLRYTLGVGSPALPIMTILIGARYLWIRRPIVYSLKFWGIILFFISTLVIFHHYKIPVNREIMPENLVPGGGFVAGLLLLGLRKLFGVLGALIAIVAVAVCAVILSTTWSLTQTLQSIKEKITDKIINFRAMTATSETPADLSNFAANPQFYNQEKDMAATLVPIDLPVEEHYTPDTNANTNTDTVTGQTELMPQKVIYSIPPLSLLKKTNKNKNIKLSKELTDNARLLEETLDNFGVKAKIINTCQGPTVTRYELEPAPGIKVSRIINLADDIALKLAALGIRIEAPIPGKAAIGIEVPNKEISSVPLRDVLESEEFQRAPSKLTVALGKDIAGQPIIADLAKMPHLLVAGATGSGKSVCINTLITSILFKANPQEVKFILIDPKVVELSNYNGIPHLMTAVVTDSKKAASSLRWAVQEMERRYALFAAAGVRDIARYNELINDGRLPLIVIIIDELADLMMVAPVDVEDAICRLAQMARAAGLHLVLATQRPSVDVITGTIKANVPSRISFAVSSQVDSRTILDMAGAEKLLGKGDMLFYPVGTAKPLRVQGAFISDAEVEELIIYIKKQAEPEYTEGITSIQASEETQKNESYEDELLEEAVRIILETGQASVSMLQRKFRIGYSRAARLIDTIEEMKIIGPNVGSKAREIIMTSDQVYSRYFRR